MPKRRVSWPPIRFRWWLLIDGLFRMRTWMFSFCVHALLLIILGLLILPPADGPNSLLLDMGSTGPQEQQSAALECIPMLSLPSDTELEQAATDLSAALREDSTPVVPPVPMLDVTAAPQPLTLSPHAPLSATAMFDLEAGQVSAPGGMAGRGGRRRRALGLGASPQSEMAVDRALAWLAEHQMSDGGWSFQLENSLCRGRCDHSGFAADTRHAATALALLPFLGAAQTQRHGTYQHVVGRGLQFLVRRADQEGSFLEPLGRMYSHGIATLVLCETVAMSRPVARSGHAPRDRALVSDAAVRRAAQRGVNFIVAAQHTAGGWRYAPGEPGDTSVVAWQAMALRSAQMAGLRVPTPTMRGIDTFLDHVQVDDYGATYGYLDGSALREGTTAAGLLCRLYSGWRRGHPGIVNGAEQLAEWGPSVNNVYYNYYSTQVLHHYQGPLWETWNELLRDYLVAQQSRSGHAAGSWFFADDFGSEMGGRLYVTAMCTMNLEVYYRHMPIYSQDAVAAENRERLPLGAPPDDLPEW